MATHKGLRIGVVEVDASVDEVCCSVYLLLTSVGAVYMYLSLAADDSCHVGWVPPGRFMLFSAVVLLADHFHFGLLSTLFHWSIDKDYCHH